MRTDGLHAGFGILLRATPYLFAAASLAVILIFVLLAQYAHPTSDDFCMAAGVRQHGLFTQLWNHYFEWSGRYSSNALYAVYPVLFGLFEAYRFIPALVVVALFLSMACFLSTLLATRLTARPVLLAALGFVTVYLLGLLSPASSLYWMAGAFTYQTANALLLVMMALMIRLADKQQQSGRIAALLVAVLIVVVIAIGANETGMLAITAVAGFGVVFSARSAVMRVWPWLVILAVALACFAAVYFSPGNEVRSADFAMRHDLSRSVKGSLSVGSRILWTWISSPVLLVATLLAPFAVNRLLQAAGRQLRVSTPQAVALLLCTLVMPIVLQFPAWWSMGGWPPARTVDAIYFLFLLCWFATIAAVTARVRLSIAEQGAKPVYLRYASITVVILALSYPAAAWVDQTFVQARADLLRLGRPYSDYLHRRYQVIDQALSENRLFLAVADYDREYPVSIYFNDIMRDPDHWRNVCYAEYFGLARIKRQ